VDEFSRPNRILQAAVVYQYLTLLQHPRSNHYRVVVGSQGENSISVSPQLVKRKIRLSKVFFPPISFFGSIAMFGFPGLSAQSELLKCP
jgi:hypothetical protein